MTPSPTSRRFFRLFSALLAISLAGAMLSPAAATPQEDKAKRLMEDAKTYEREFERAQLEARILGRRLSASRAELASLRADVQGLKGEVELATKEYEKLQAILDTTQDKQADVKLEVDGVQERMDLRVREAFKQGPAGALDILLGASSVSDLSERETFLNALQAQDSNTTDTLDALNDDLKKLAHEQRVNARAAEKALKYLRGQEFALADARDREAEQAAALAKDLRAAHLLEKKWAHKIDVTLKKLGTIACPDGDCVFQACPVPNYSWIADDFGAPRVGHLHAGNDIGAPMGADIVAPFPGSARASTDSLGGLSVHVYGKDGYVYNTHLSSTEGSFPRHVEAGEVIGHVGMTGNAQGTVPHDHFEYHPNNTGGERVISGAIDPNPLLDEVCKK